MGARRRESRAESKLDPPAEQSPSCDNTNPENPLSPNFNLKLGDTRILLVSLDILTRVFHQNRTVASF
jgi:hypothetical protein